MTSQHTPFRTFVDELRRRRVFRTGGWYAGSAFVLLQAADLLLPALGAPEWVMSVLVMLALLAFPVVLALGWAVDFSEGRLHRTGAEAAGNEPAGAGPEPQRAHAPAAAPWRVWPRVALVTVVALAATAAGAVLYRRAARPLTTESVAVMPFTVRGGELEYLREGMVELLSRNLDGAGGLRAVDPASVLLTLVQEDDAGVVDASAARRVSRRVGAGWYVIGSIVEVGGRVRLQAALHGQEETGDEPAHTARAEGPTDSIFGLADRLAAQLLSHWGGRQGRRLAEAAAVTTSSLDAFKAYLSAEDHLRGARFDSALAGYRQATEHDPRFALAWYRLAVTGAWSLAVTGAWSEAGDSVVDSALDRAREHADNLSSRDRRLFEAFGAFQDGVPRVAEPAYRSIRRDYPDDLEATFQLADLLFHYTPVLGRPQTESYALFREVLRLDPEFLCPI